MLIVFQIIFTESKAEIMWIITISGMQRIPTDSAFPNTSVVRGEGMIRNFWVIPISLSQIMAIP